MTLTDVGRGAPGAHSACRILLMAALPQEVRPFLRRMQAKARRDLGLPAWAWAGGAGVAVLSGMGGAAARRAVEILVARCRPGLLVSLGFGGALAPGLAAGELVLGETFWHYDPDTGALRAGPQPVPPRPLPGLRRALEAAGLPAAIGSLITTSRIISKGRQGGSLAGLPTPVLDLETGWLAAVAAARDLPFLSLRAITDVAGEEIPGFLHQAGCRETTVGVGSALRWLAADPKRGADLLKLWSRSRRAGRALAAAMTVLWPLLLTTGGDFEDQPAQEG